MNLPYTYEPLFQLLDKLDMTLDDLAEKKVLSAGTIEKIATGQQVMAASVAKICLELGCELNDVIALNYDYDPTEIVDDGTQNYKPWTKEDDERLIDEYQNDFPVSVIAHNLTRSPGAVSSRISKLVFSGKLEKRESKKKRG